MVGLGVTMQGRDRPLLVTSTVSGVACSHLTHRLHPRSVTSRGIYLNHSPDTGRVRGTNMHFEHGSSTIRTSVLKLFESFAR